MKDIDVFGLKVSIYDAGKSEKSGREFPKGISLTLGQNYMRLSALQFVGMCKLLDDSEVTKELRIRIREEKELLAGVEL